MTKSEFRKEQSRYLDVAQREPVFSFRRGTRRRAVVVSPDFYDRVLAALEDGEDVLAAEPARWKGAEIAHEDHKEELGL